MKKIMLVLCLGMFFISLASAISIGDFPQNQNVQIYQTCNNCTDCNFTRVMKQNNQTILSNIEATQDGNYYYYDVDKSLIDTLGIYKYCYDCGNAVERDTGCIDFSVTPSGQGGTDNLVFFIFVILLIYSVTFISFFGKNIPLTILGGMLMMFLGLYMIVNGIIIFRDTLTIYLSYVTISIGFIMAMWAALEQFDIL